ncbi:dihydroxyacetone kinase subunit DhaL [Actinomadura sp. ATCC 31491]|uniref:Dihydroxyacetone kinase subunit DhaL n=1 Tax=Actinomadura luzonensis TaxID=2805427 RepID=A0ABT0G0P9_9ACTN|nr:dihydroxyacetone kinase subunit DhaL [Actinomadura luzonensis]MCK2218099.1 dihydroxyacetone kinase subunit DhaL [Actinomadura luzonensis]
MGTTSGESAGSGSGAESGQGAVGGLAAGLFVAWFEEAARLVRRDRDRLTALDAAIGDADHGTNLDRGLTEVVKALGETPPESAAQVFAVAGATLIRKVGGAAGPLYGSVFRQMGRMIEEPVTLAGFAGAFEAGVVALERLGKAALGDKTMVDALVPAARALALALRDGVGAREAFELAARAAAEGAEGTIPMQARKGRASYLGERSVGHEDPGAASSALFMAALATVTAKA